MHLNDHLLFFPTAKRLKVSLYPYLRRQTKSASCLLCSAIFQLCLRPYLLLSYLSHQFDPFCESHSVDHNLAAPYYPESNGKAEARIKTVKRECLTYLAVSTLAVGTLQQEVERFREYDNCHRLHRGLDYDVPAGSYCNVHLTPTLQAIPPLASLVLPHCSVPEKVPHIDS
ncbi:transposase [Candidatus Poribacteria bacterium]|nr:transposase [Candidatus Poribacteria bacterium]